MFGIRRQEAAEREKLLAALKRAERNVARTSARLKAEKAARRNAETGRSRLEKEVSGIRTEISEIEAKSKTAIGTLKAEEQVRKDRLLKRLKAAEEQATAAREKASSEARRRQQLEQEKAALSQDVTRIRDNIMSLEKGAGADIEKVRRSTEAEKQDLLKRLHAAEARAAKEESSVAGRQETEAARAWALIKDSIDAKLLASFIDKYPNASEMAEAHTRLAALRKIGTKPIGPSAEGDVPISVEIRGAGVAG